MRSFVIRRETNEAHSALDSHMLAPRMCDVYLTYFQTFTEHPDKLQANARAFWKNTCGKDSIAHQTWLAFVVRGPTAREISTYLADTHDMDVQATLQYWLKCRLMLEQKKNASEPGISPLLRNDLFSALFCEVARMVLAQECTPCDINLLQPGLTQAHVLHARKIWQTILFSEPTVKFPSRRHASRCQTRPFWYAFVRYCGTIHNVRKNLVRAKLHLNRLRARFPGGYHEMDPQSSFYFDITSTTNPTPTKHDVLRAYERMQAYVYLLACKYAIRNTHLTEGKAIHQQRRQRAKRKRNTSLRTLRLAKRRKVPT